MEDAQQFCLRWNNYQSSITSAFENLRDDEDFVDVTLASEGRSLKAHRVVLSACSPYFKELLKSTPCKHPVVVLQDVPFADLTALVQFMYHGEVNIDQGSLASFLRTAEVLHVSGLTQHGSGAANGVAAPEKRAESPSVPTSLPSGVVTSVATVPTINATNSTVESLRLPSPSQRRNSDHSESDEGICNKRPRAESNLSSPAASDGVPDGVLSGLQLDGPDGLDGATSPAPNNQHPDTKSLFGGCHDGDDLGGAGVPGGGGGVYSFDGQQFGGAAVAAAAAAAAAAPILELGGLSPFGQLAGFTMRSGLNAADIKREPGFDMLSLPGPSSMPDVSLGPCKPGQVPMLLVRQMDPKGECPPPHSDPINNAQPASMDCGGGGRTPPPPSGALSLPQLCPVCRKMFSCYYSLKRHFEDKHRQSNALYVCEFCQRSYRTKNSLTTHKSIRHRALATRSRTARRGPRGGGGGGGGGLVSMDTALGNVAAALAASFSGSTMAAVSAASTVAGSGIGTSHLRVSGAGVVPGQNPGAAPGALSVIEQPSG